MTDPNRSKLIRRVLVLAGLGTLAITAPLLDIYGGNPEVFVANRTSPAELILFAFGLGLLPFLLGALIVGIGAWIGGATEKVVYRGGLLGLGLATGLVVSRQLVPDNGWLALLAAAFIGAGVYFLVKFMDTAAILASIALPVLVAMFLFFSDTASLLSAEPPERPTEGVTIDTPHQVVMLQLDEFPLASLVTPEGEVNRNLFPSFARLADEGTWYRNALSDSIATTQSVPAILTGRRGEEGQAPSHTDRPDNLFTLLGDTYEMHVIEWVTKMCPPETCPEYAGRSPARFTSLLKDVGVVYGHLTLPSFFRDDLPSIDNAWTGFVDQDSGGGVDVDLPGLPVPEGKMRVDWANWLQRITNGIDSDNPTLSFVHVQAPHVPWETNPSGTHYERPEQYTEVEGVGGDGRWGEDPDAPLIGFQRHLSQLGFLDVLLGRLLDEIERSGGWDDTMIVVVADHGTSFVTGQHRRWPFEDNRDDLYRVPLFIKYPNQSGAEVSDLPAFGIDIVPTIVDVLGVETDWNFDGQSLLSLSDERPHEPQRWCCSGDPASSDPRILMQQVSRNYGWISDQSSWLGVAAVGESAAMVGASAVELVAGSDDSFSWSLDLGKTLATNEAEPGMVQTLITGRAEIAPSFGDELLFVSDGVVAGVMHLTQETESTATFTGFVAEELVAGGNRDVDLLANNGTGWVSGSRSDISLELSDIDGRPLKLVSEGTRRLQVDDIEWFGDVVRITGWAADVRNKVTADTIYVFSGERLVAWGPPNTENGNVVRWFESEDLLISGFVFEIETVMIDESAQQLLVVAEFGDESIADRVVIER